MNRTLRHLVPRRLLRAERLRRLLEEQSNGVVMSGPFRGMRYARRAFGSLIAPKILGTYEVEIADEVERRIARGYERIVVAGAAEGYYAVGFALRLPACRVTAFEVREEARQEMAAVASENGVADRVEIRGLCDVPSLEEAINSSFDTLLLCDIEGTEAVLLDPRVLPVLSSLDIIVETHEEFVPGVERAIEGRFLATHDIRGIAQVPRRAEDAKFLGATRRLGGALEQLLSERRPAGNAWMVLLAKATGSRAC